MERKAHKIRAPKNNTFPKQLIFYDMETYKQNRRLKTRTKTPRLVTRTINKTVFGHFFHVKYNEYKKKYEDVEEGYIADGDGKSRNEFVKLLDCIAYNTQRTVWVFAHNIQFDYKDLNPGKELRRLGYSKTGKCIIESNKYIVEWKKKKKNGHSCVIKFLDTMQFMSGALKNIGETIGTPKMNIGLDKYGDMLRWMVHEKDRYDDTWETAKKYCRQDNVVIKELIIKLIKFICWEEKGSFKETIAGCSFGLLKKHLEHEIFISPEMDEFEKEAYYGGRTEVFKAGTFTEKIYAMDINSQYPSVMYGNLYPTKKLYTITNPSRRWFIEQRKIFKKKNLIYIVKAKVNLKEEKLPYRYKDKLCFPIGKIYGTWTSAEFDLVRDDEIINIEEIAIYNSGQIFNKFVEKYYTLREEAKKKGDKIYSNFYKLLLNSSYGKWGQCVRKTERAPELDKPYNYNGNVEEVDVLGEPTIIKYIEGEAYVMTKEDRVFMDAFIAIAAFVTAYARRQIWEGIQTVGKENVYYTDTDSIFTNQEGYNKLKERGLVHDSKLGHFNIDYSGDIIQTITLKDYKIWKIIRLFNTSVTILKKKKLKGIPKNARKIDEDTYEVKNITSQKESSNRFGIIANIDEIIIKKRNRKYSKRHVFYDGSTFPLVGREL